MATMATTVSFANALSRIASDLWYRTVHVPVRENLLYDFIADLRSNGFAKTSDYVTSLAIAVFITFLRHYATLYLFQSFTKTSGMEEKTGQKFCESAWKAIFYATSWSYCLYLVTCKYPFFNQPESVWFDFEVGMDVPADIYWVYMIQLGFYFHSIFASLFMDEVRRDFVATIFHHVLTICLISFSLTIRYHNIGLMVIFFHDVTDILMELSKCSLYMKQRNDTKYPLWGHVANVGFMFFMITWFVSRMYWFFFKVLYSAGHLYLFYMPEPRLYVFFNAMLWMLCFLNVYWFYYIIKVALRIIYGQEVKDSRDIDDEKKRD